MGGTATKTDDDVAQVMADITAGRYTPEQAAVLLDQLSVWALSQDVRVVWRIAVDGWEVDEGSLTGGEAMAMEAKTGRTWHYLNPIRSAGDAIPMLAVLLRTRSGLSEEDAQERAEAYSRDELNEIIGAKAAIAAPFESGSESTSES